MRCKVLLLALVLGLASPLARAAASPQDANEGIWQGYDGEWRYTSRLLLQLAEAIPADKYGWRPAPGVRSVSEVYMHIVIGDDYLLRPTGFNGSPPLDPGLEKTVTTKPEVLRYLRRSLDQVRTAHLQLKPGELQRRVVIEDQAATVDGMYLRILAHANEHMGQLIAYARFNGIVPPWSQPASTGK